MEKGRTLLNETTAYFVIDRGVLKVASKDDKIRELLKQMEAIKETFNNIEIDIEEDNVEEGDAVIMINMMKEFNEKLCFEV